MRTTSGIKLSVKFVNLGILVLILLIIFPPAQYVLGANIYAKDDTIFGHDYSYWISEWWRWWVTTDDAKATPDHDGCLMNNTTSVVMLMETAVGGKPHQNCKISSLQGILIPLWTGWCDESAQGHEHAQYNELAKCAREEARPRRNKIKSYSR